MGQAPVTSPFPVGNNEGLQDPAGRRNLPGMDWLLLANGFLIFLARVIDVSMGTLRTIVLVQGRSVLAFVLGLIESSLWLIVVAAVLQQIQVNPLLGIFYALGFSVGNVVGIALERRIALGNVILRIISAHYEPQMTQRLRKMGLAVTVFTGEGRDGPVRELYVVCRRRDFKKIIRTVEEIDPRVFYVTEQPGTIRKLRKAWGLAPGGWQAVGKRK